MADEQRLINANALSEEISSLSMFMTGIRFGQGVLREYIKEYRKSILKIVDDAPTVDAVEVVHGRWEPRTDAIGFVRCSVCRGCNIYDDWADGKKWNYCPHCGAKMDGGNEDDR